MNTKKILQDYLDRKMLKISILAARSGVSYSSIYQILKNNLRARRYTANRICRATDGELTLKDFGYDE